MLILQNFNDRRPLVGNSNSIKHLLPLIVGSKPLRRGAVQQLFKNIVREPASHLGAISKNREPTPLTWRKPTNTGSVTERFKSV